jgi:hypothetical protein
MKRWLTLSAFFFTTAAMAQSAIYEKIKYRDDDVFVFCTQGRDDNNKAWEPHSPYLGRMDWNSLKNFCPVPDSPQYECPANVYPYVIFDEWSQDDWDAFQLYERICPYGEEEGSWTGNDKPERTPKIH